MKKSELRQIIREELVNILYEAGYTGTMSGTQEKEFSTGLRNIHKKFEDPDRSINVKTNHSTINYGGCGIFAQLLYYNMRKYLGITPEIVIFDWPWNQELSGTYGVNQYDSLGEFAADGYTCIHITLKVNDYYIDSSGIHKKQWFEKAYRSKLLVHEGMKIQTLVKWVRSSDAWNPTFDRYSIGDINDDMVEVMKHVRDIGLSKK